LRRTPSALGSAPFWTALGQIDHADLCLTGAPGRFGWSIVAACSGDFR
jgi:hypothetical protein